MARATEINSYEKSDIGTMEMYRLCNAQNWFTEGFGEEYDQLADMVREQEPICRLARYIADHSSENVKESDIAQKLTEIDRSYQRKPVKKPTKFSPKPKKKNNLHLLNKTRIMEVKIRWDRMIKPCMLCWRIKGILLTSAM